MLNIGKTPEFFAAANGHDGFISYFDKIFASEDFTRTYVLKGGPGTGKSSFMKRLAKLLGDRGIYTELIYCSSDPRSLDGVIFEAGDRRVAIIDGTAPHERDAIIPGAIDSIINLGENWNERWLIASRARITPLCHEKSTAYRTAYYYLSLAGRCHDKIMSVKRSGFSAKKFKNKLKSLAEYIPGCSDSLHMTRLISSVGRSGITRFNTLDTPRGKHFTVMGSEESRLIFMTELCAAICGVRGIVAPSPLSPKLYEGVYLTESDVSFTFAGDGEIIDADELFSVPEELDREKVRVAREMLRVATDEAVRWFSIASDLHFRLEEIYTVAMDFEKNDRTLTETYEKISEILDA